MSNKQLLETGLMLGGATLGVVGAAMIEPFLIGAGAVAAGAVAVMRFKDQRNAVRSIDSGSPFVATQSK